MPVTVNVQTTSGETVAGSPVGVIGSPKQTC